MNNFSKLSLSFYTKYEVTKHCISNDCWLSIDEYIFDISSIILSPNCDKEVKNFYLQNAGHDLSSYFNLNQEFQYTLTPNNELFNLLYNNSNENTNIKVTSWWKNEEFLIGKISKLPILLKFVNNLLVESEETKEESSEVIVECCGEEILENIKPKFENFWLGSKSYIWKKLEKDGKLVPLDMTKTLFENGYDLTYYEIEKLGLPEKDSFNYIYVEFVQDL